MYWTYHYLWVRSTLTGRLLRRRDNFVENNRNSLLIKHSETLKYSEWRIRTRTVHRDRSLQKQGWKSNLHLHWDHFLYSNTRIETTDDNGNINTTQRDIAFQEGHCKISNQVSKPGDTTCEVQMQTWKRTLASFNLIIQEDISSESTSSLKIIEDAFYSPTGFGETNTRDHHTNL